MSVEANAGFQVTSVGGLIVAVRKLEREVDETLAVLPVGQPDALLVAADKILRAAGHEPAEGDATAFADGFLGHLKAQRFGVRNLRASVVADWIAARRRRGAGEARP